MGMRWDKEQPVELESHEIERDEAMEVVWDDNLIQTKCTKYERGDGVDENTTKQNEAGAYSPDR